MSERGRRSGRATLFPVALLAAAALSIGALALVGHFRGGGSAAGDEGESALPAPPPPAGAFAHGGVPSYGDEQVRKTFAETLPSYAIALDGWARTRRRRKHDAIRARKGLDKARSRLLSPAARASLGDPVAGALELVAARARQAAEAPERKVDDAADELAAGVLTLDDALAAAGLGYFVDSDVLSYSDSGRRVVLLFTFRVTQVNRYRVGGRVIRALQLRRLDSLNWTYRLLGFTAPRRRDALVLLGRVDDRLLQGVLPALAPDASADLWDLSSEQEQGAWYRRLSARASEVVRRELSGVGEPGQAERLGRLVGQRLALFRSWNQLLARRKLVLEPPETLTLKEDLAARLTGVVPEKELEQLGRLETALGTSESESTFGAVRELLVRSVEQHEIQHRVDALEPKPSMPAPLAALVGPLRDDRGQERELAARARAELSAYLAELARDRVTGGLGLALVAGFVADERMWGSAECYAALVIFDELARELDVQRAGPLLKGRRIDRDRAIDRYIALSRAPAGDLRAAARRIWRRLFGGELQALEKL